MSASVAYETIIVVLKIILFFILGGLSGKEMKSGPIQNGLSRSRAHNDTLLPCIKPQRPFTATFKESDWILPIFIGLFFGMAPHSLKLAPNSNKQPLQKAMSRIDPQHLHAQVAILRCLFSSTAV